MLVQGVLQQDPFSGHLFVFRGRKANLIKIVFWDGTACASSPSGSSRASSSGRRMLSRPNTALTSAQLSALIDGVDWRAPEKQWRPAAAG